MEKKSNDSLSPSVPGNNPDSAGLLLTYNKLEPCFGQKETVLNMIKQHHVSKLILAFR